jgi:hypothetical protein
MPGSGGIVMALPLTLLAGLLMLSSVQAKDIADSSKNHGFLPNYMPLLSESSKSSIGDSGMFMAHYLNHMERGGRTEALSDQYGLADDSSATVGSSHPDIFTSARAGAVRTSKDFEPQKIEGMEEDKDVQKLFTNESNMPIGLSVIGIAFLSFAVMVGVRMRRGVQPAIALASSGGNGIDMSLPLATVSSNNTWDLMSQCPPVRSPEHMLQGSERALAEDMHAQISGPFALWDPLGLGEDAPEAHVKNFRRSELQHGLVAMSAMTSVFFVSLQKPNPMSAATLRAELTPEEKTQREIENRKKITRALIDATEARNQEQIQIALATAEKGGGFGQNDPEIMEAMKAYKELNDLSDVVRNKLVKKMRQSQPGDEEFQNPGNLYLGIFGLMTVLVIAGGKDIFYTSIPIPTL